MIDKAPDMDEKEDQPGTCGEKKCPELPKPDPAPELPPPEECKPDPCCNCAPPPGGTLSNCLDDLIRRQSKVVRRADRAKAFVEELTGIQTKAVAAQATYTVARNKELVKIWTDQDKLIAELLQKLVCAVPCWECLLECHLCQDLHEIRTLERKLYGTGELTGTVFSLVDLQHWHERNVEHMQARVDRIKAVLAAWEDPSTTLGEILTKNGELHTAITKIIATDSAKAVYDVFMTLLPLHWLIRPRSATSKIQQRFLDICECDKGEPDDCCGPDVGVLGLRFRLLQPRPYLIDPAKLIDVICCLANERLLPASGVLADAQAELDATKAEIESVKAQITERTESLEKNFLLEVGNPVDCEKYESQSTPPPSGSQTTPPPAAN